MASDRVGFCAPAPCQARLAPPYARPSPNWSRPPLLRSSILVAVTAVSIGIARADAAIVDKDGGRWALAVFLALFIAGMGGITAFAARDGKTRSRLIAARRSVARLRNSARSGFVVVRIQWRTAMNRCALACASIVALAADPAAAQTFRSSAGNLNVETVARGLRHPWGLAFLPDGRMLVTERPGQMRIAARDGKLSPPLAGVPRVFASGQGGLARCRARSRLCPQQHHLFLLRRAGERRRAHVDGARAPCRRRKLEDVRVIFRQEGPLSSGNHFGCRIVQTPDNNLFLTTGDHFTTRDEAQNLANHLGKIVRMRPDGSVPPDNPFVGRQGAKPEIWSYGHRNMQGAALQPGSNRYWTHEHGARGGDEINVPQAGKNYGWPVITHGIDYSGAKIGIGTHKEGMEQPVWQWTPSIAPSGMAFYAGDLFPAWRGHLFVGALAGKMLVRLEVDGERVGKEERLLRELGERIRDVRSGPDGALWLLTDSSSGRILRIAPCALRIVPRFGETAVAPPVADPFCAAARGWYRACADARSAPQGPRRINRTAWSRCTSRLLPTMRASSPFARRSPQSPNGAFRRACGCRQRARILLGARFSPAASIRRSPASKTWLLPSGSKLAAARAGTGWPASPPSRARNAHPLAGGRDLRPAKPRL